MNKENVGKKVGGVSARKLIIPIAVVMAVLHVMIVALILMINTTSSGLSINMQSAGRYVSDATSLLAGSSLLSETCSNYVLMPVTEAGEVNVFPLMSYAQELQNTDRRGDAVLKRFRTYDVDPETLSMMEEAAA